MKQKRIVDSRFGERLRKLRKRENLTMEELCEKFNKKYAAKLNKCTISRYENVSQEPMLNTVELLADFFRVSPTYLIGQGEDCNSMPAVEENPAENNRSIVSAYLTPHERTVIQAYRSQPEMQPAVDRILGVEEDLEIDLAEDMTEALVEGDQMAHALSMKKSIPSSK